MLPRPNNARYTRSKWFKQRSLTRSQVVLWLMVCFLFISLGVNVKQWNSKPKIHIAYTSLNKEDFKFASHLIVVAGHAIWKGCNNWDMPDNWVLHEYQKGNDSVKAFYTHIVKGAEILRDDPAAVLVFSGGVTRPTHPSHSEAQSYLSLALESNLVSTSRAYTEDYALDSFQNLLFSIMRYHELAIAAGKSPSWPEKITIVGFEMKRRRFVELHRAALRWPQDRFHYIGVDLADREKSEQAAQGELLHGYQPYTQDLYGCTGQLASKRNSRNPFARFHPYYTTNPELAPLIDWCPGAGSIQSQIYRGPLPWDRL